MLSLRLNSKYIRYFWVYSATTKQHNHLTYEYLKEQFVFFSSQDLNYIYVLHEIIDNVTVLVILNGILVVKKIF